MVPTSDQIIGRGDVFICVKYSRAECIRTDKQINKHNLKVRSLECSYISNHRYCIWLKYSRYIIKYQNKQLAYIYTMYVIILSNDAFIIIGNFEITNTRLLVLELVGCTLFNNTLDSYALCLNSSNFMTTRIKVSSAVAGVCRS